MKIIRFHQDGAFSVIAVLIAVVVLSSFVAVAFSFTSSNGRMAQRSRQLAAAEGVAEGGLELLFARWRAAGRAGAVSNQGLPSTSDISTMTGASHAPGGNDYPDFAGYTFSNYTLTPVDQFNVPVTGNPPPGNPVPVAGRPGWVARTHNYRAEATVTAPALGGEVSTTVTRRFQKADAPIFQAAIFYEMDLEIHPSPTLAITGLVHTNSNLYAAGDPGAIIFNRNVSFVGEYNEGYAPGDPRTAYTAPTFAYSMDSQLNKVGRLEPLGDEPTSIFNTTDSNANNDSYRELIERPNTAQTDPQEIAPLRFYNQAGLRILVDTSLTTTDANRVKIYNGRGVQLTTAGGTAVSNVITSVKAALSAGETIKDNREGNNVLLTSFDLSKLTDITTKMALLPAATNANAASQAVNTYNGIIYITDVSGSNSGGTTNVNGSSTTKAEKAIRLKNGAILPSHLSIASENPVYIQGDFNTGGTGTAVPSNNTTTSSPSTSFLQPNVAAYTRKSCAVLADAVNILSGAWVDANSTAASSSRVASNTTVNTAILSGIIPTNHNGNTRYSGGAENFPRFHENWSNKNFCYYGSMVSFFLSKQGNSPWGSSNVYSPPLRRWYFDNNFIQNPPPGTLHSFTYSRGRWARN
jgi:hypothetical protein